MQHSSEETIPRKAIAFCFFVMKKQKKAFILLFLLSFVAAGINAMGAYVFKMVIDAISTSSKELVWQAVFPSLALYTLIIGSNAVLFPICTKYSISLFASATVFLKDFLFRKVLSWPYKDHIDRLSGEMAQKIDTAQGSLDSLLTEIFWGGTWLAANFVIFAYFSFQTPVLLAPLVLWVILEVLIVRSCLPRIASIQKESSEVRSDIS